LSCLALPCLALSCLCLALPCLCPCLVFVLALSCLCPCLVLSNAYHSALQSGRAVCARAVHGPGRIRFEEEKNTRAALFEWSSALSSAVKSDRFYQDRLGTKPNWQNGKWSQRGVGSNPTYRRKLWRPREYHRRTQRDSGREHAGRCCARGYSAPLLVWIYFKIYLDLFWARSRNLLVFLVLLMRRETVLCQDRLGTNKNGNDPYSQEKEETVSHTHVSLSLSLTHTHSFWFLCGCVWGGGRLRWLRSRRPLHVSPRRRL
jgi:hypothetical protein